MLVGEISDCNPEIQTGEAYVPDRSRQVKKPGPGDRREAIRPGIDKLCGRMIPESGKEGDPFHRAPCAHEVEKPLGACIVRKSEFLVHRLRGPVLDIPVGFIRAAVVEQGQIGGQFERLEDRYPSGRLHSVNPLFVGS